MKSSLVQNKILFLVTLVLSFLIAFLAWNGFGIVSEPENLSVLTHKLFRTVCHQSPERSFIFNAIQLPVCGRCLGIYSAIPFGVLLLGIPLRPKNTYDRKRIVKMVMIVSLFLLFEVVLEMLYIIHVDNEFRFSTGFVYISIVSILAKSIK